jgi:TRAP-type C4-dicarboxylate transport system substrate-binding protein
MMMKRSVYLAIALIFVIVALHVPAVQAQSKTKLKKIPLTWADHIPPVAGGNIFVKKQYFPRIQAQLAKIGYELDVTFYHAASLFPMPEQVNACDQGLVDMTIAVLPYEKNRAPLHEVLDFGFMGWDGRMLNEVWAEMNKSIPEFDKELSSSFVELFRFIPTPRYLHHNKEGARVPSDFKGVKIHSSGIAREMFKSIGAVPIKQSSSDWYTSIDRGLFDGVAVAFDMVHIMKLYEVLNYHILYLGDSLGFTPVTHVMNRRKFESLPQGVQKAFLDNVEWASESMLKDELTRLPLYKSGPEKKGNVFYDLSPEETEKWRQAFLPIHVQWVEKLEKEGKPARKVYEEATRLVKQYAK